MHQNEWFQVWFFKNFLGRGSPSPLPRPLPPLFLGLRPRFGLRPQFSGASRPRLGLRPRYSGASRPRFGLRPQLSIGDLGLAPPKINSWIRPWWCNQIRIPVNFWYILFPKNVYRSTTSPFMLGPLSLFLSLPLSLSFSLSCFLSELW